MIAADLIDVRPAKVKSAESPEDELDADKDT
jgi:hypothetical protein